MVEPDLSPGCVEARLQELGRLYRDRRLGLAADMRAEAVEQRLRKLADLNRACRELEAAGRRAGL